MSNAPRIYKDERRQLLLLAEMLGHEAGCYEEGFSVLRPDGSRVWDKDANWAAVRAFRLRRGAGLLRRILERSDTSTI